MTGKVNADDTALAALRDRFPGWVVWRGTHTGGWWAAPPPGHPHRALVSCASVAALARRLGEIAGGQPGG